MGEFKIETMNFHCTIVQYIVADLCYVPVILIVHIHRLENRQPKHRIIINNNNISMSSNQEQTVVMPPPRTEKDVFTVTALRKALDQLAIPEHQTELILEQLFVPSSSAAATTTTPVASVVAAPSAVAVAVTSGTDK